MMLGIPGYYIGTGAAVNTAFNSPSPTRYDSSLSYRLLLYIHSSGEHSNLTLRYYLLATNKLKQGFSFYIHRQAIAKLQLAALTLNYLDIRYYVTPQHRVSRFRRLYN
jgi:hypothetical protein